MVSDGRSIELVEVLSLLVTLVERPLFVGSDRFKMSMKKFLIHLART